MWRACRVAALRQLRLSGTPSAQPSLALQHLQSAGYFTSIAGVDRQLLLKRSSRELQDELGAAKLGEVSKALRYEMTNALKREDVTSDEIIDLFTAAQKTRAISVMLDGFEFLDTKFPTHINFAVYGEMFRILMRRKDSKRLIEIYESSKTRFKNVPEMIYRFGITGHLEEGNVEKAVEIWEEMQSAGHETTNEITSRLMMAYARRGEKDKVLELYDSVDPQIGYWHESCIDRVILSMGIIEQPAKSFEFYSNSSMKLNGGTLIALLSVCNNNNCTQQAADILANRKKFDLRLDARGYNRIMMTLETLERNDEIQDILEEMVDNNVRFDTRTHNIIKRNADFLQDTNFVIDAKKSKAGGFTISPRIRELLGNGDNDEAAAVADSAVKPVTQENLPDNFEGDIPEGAMIVAPSVARDAVRTYIKTNQHDKVSALLKGFSVVKGKYAYALAEVIHHYLRMKTKMGDEMSYHASKAMLYQGLPVYRVNDTMMLFRRFHDVGATLALFDQVLDDYSGNIDSGASSHDVENDDANDDGAKKSTYYVNFNVGKVINVVLQTLGENGKLSELLELIDKMHDCGLSTTQVNYSTILRSMNKEYLNATYGSKKSNGFKYEITDFQTVLNHLKSHGVKPNKTIVGYLCPAYGSANKQQRLELLEAYAEASTDPNDTYVPPLRCYETLLLFTAQEGDMEDLKRLYDDAVSVLDDKENRGVPRDWVTILITKHCHDGNLEEAEKLTKQMPELCGGFTYPAIMSVLRASLAANNADVADSMLELLEDRGFTVSLGDAYELVHVARQHDLALKGLTILRLFEKGNLKEVPEADDGKGILKDALVRRRESEAHATRKVKTMYTVVLKNCEKTGLWKQALVLRDRMAILFGQEALNEITAHHNPSRKYRQPKETDHEEAAHN